MKEKRSEWSFQIRRVLIFLTLGLIYAFVSFQRTCPSIVAEEMANSYNVPKGELSLFSSIFFYAYAAVQPFAGLFADIMEPAILVGVAQIVSSAGAVICGFSNTMLIGCIGKFLVGISCGFVFVPLTRCNANWFTLKWFPIIAGVNVVFAGAGGIAAQGPLALMCAAVGWRNSFFIIGGATFFFGAVCLILFVEILPL